MMTPTLADTAAQLRIAMFRLTRRLRCVRAPETVSDAQVSVLATLRHHGRYTLSALADHEHVTAPTMSTIVTGLVELGYVTRATDDEDRRRVQLDITSVGEAIIAETVRRRDARLAEMLEAVELTDEEVQTLHRSAAILRKVAEQ